MKESLDLYYLAALADKETENSADADKLKDEVEKNQELKYEYDTQVLIKSLVSKKSKISPAPGKVKKNLKRKIKSVSKSGFIAGHLPGIYTTKPIIAWGSSIIIIVSIILIFFNRFTVPANNYFVKEQTGRNNLIVQAKSNFENILKGNIKPQVISSNPEQIRQFFKEKGIRDSINIPTFKNWVLKGAFVMTNEENATAHIIYSNENEDIVYIYQVNEKELKGNKFLTLTDDLIAYLDTRNCYISTERNPAIIMTKLQGNIFAVISNGSLQEIENKLCKTK